jgi:xylulokinase
VPLPDLVWSDQVSGRVRADAAAATGLPQGTAVLGGTVDAWAEAASVGVTKPGDLMLMYGSTMFMIGVTGSALPHAGLWATAGLRAGASTLAAGMSASGLLTTWVSEMTGRSVPDLSRAAESVPPGADGLALLPYLAGERSPLFDPDARGVIAGLHLRHTPAHLMRAAYEAVGMGIRHNLEAFGQVRGAGDQVTGRWRPVAVGGGASDRLWTQIVSDITGMAQAIPAQTIGASYGDALLAARAAGLTGPGENWNAVREDVRPRPELRDFYDGLYGVYRDLYPATRPLIGRLSEAVGAALPA